MSLQPARKRSGMNAPSRANEKAHENRAVERNAAVRARRHASAFGIKFFHLRFKNRAYFFLAGTHCWGFLLVCGVSISERIAPHN